MNFYIIKRTFISLLILVFFLSCTPNKNIKEEQINLNSATINDSVRNSIQDDVPLSKIATKPNSVILTGHLHIID